MVYYAMSKRRKERERLREYVWVSQRERFMW